MVMVILLFLTLLGVSFAQDTIYTWYYGKQLASFLSSVNAYLSSASFIDLWKIVLGFSFILLALAVIASGGDYRQALRLLWFYGIVIVVWYLFVQIRVPVVVEDRCTKITYRGLQAPWAVAKPLSWFTTLEKNVRDGLVSFFGNFLPNAYKQNEGCFTGYELLKPAITYQPQDPYLRLSLQNYIKDCIIPTVLAGDIDRFSLVNSNNLWDLFRCGTGRLCAALTTTYFNQTYPEGIVDSCPNVYARISADLVKEYPRAWKSIKEKVFGTASAISESVIPSYLGEVSQFLMAVGMSGENLIRQAITIQTLNQVSAEFATAVAYQEAYLNSLAKINALDFGRGGTLNAMKGVIEAIVIGLTPAFALLFLTPLGGRLFASWLTLLLWLAMWSVAEVVVVSFLFLSVGDNQKFNFTLADLDKLNLAFNKAAQISSLMSDYIPLITFVLATGSVYAMTKFAGGLTEELKSSRGMEIMATGNFSAGNIQTRSYSDLVQALANSTVGSVGWWSVGVGGVSGYNTDLYNTKALQTQSYDAKLNANFSGVWDGTRFIGEVRGKDFIGRGVFEKTQDGRLRLVSGELEAYTPSAMKEIGGIDYLRSGKVIKDNGRVVYAGGIGLNVPGNINTLISKDGQRTDNYEVGAVSAKFVGGRPVEVNFGGVKLAVSNAHIKSMEEKRSFLEGLSYRLAKGLGSEKVDAKTLDTSFQYAYQMALGYIQASEEAREWAKHVVRGVALTALENLGKRGEVQLNAKKISAEEANNIRQMGIEFNVGGILGKVLKFVFGVGGGGEFKKAWINKDGILFEDGEGKHWFVGFNESIQNELRKAWEATLRGGNKQIYENIRKASQTNITNETISQRTANLMKEMAEYVSRQEQEIGYLLNLAKQDSAKFEAALNQLFLDKIAREKFGGDYEKALMYFNELLSTPEGVKKLMEEINAFLREFSGLSEPDKEKEEMLKSEEFKREVESEAKKAREKGEEAKGVEVERLNEDPARVFEENLNKIKQTFDSLGSGFSAQKRKVDAIVSQYQKAGSPLKVMPQVKKLYEEGKQKVSKLLDENTRLTQALDQIQLFRNLQKNWQGNPEELRKLMERNFYSLPVVKEITKGKEMPLEEIEKELQKRLEKNLRELEKWQKAMKPLEQTMKAYDLLKERYEANREASPLPWKEPGITTETEKQMKELEERLRKGKKRKTG